MKPALVLGVLAALAAPAGANGQEPPEFNDKCGALDCRVERVPARWQVVSVGRDLDTLKLVYQSGGCRVGDGHATVTEMASRIRIAVDEGEVVAIDTPDRQVVCTLELRYRTLHVQLHRPVGGRRILGASKVAGGIPKGRVPRVLDLAFDDARAVLRSQGFKVRRFARRAGRVAFQSPRPGRRAPGDTVGLTLGHHAFHARSLAACFDAAGVPVIPVRPGPGDDDAPDLELSPSGIGARAFVAFYADPARARENARSIRRNARRFKGVVERLGRVTIVWVEPPDPFVRERARACVAGAKP